MFAGRRYRPTHAIGQGCGSPEGIYAALRVRVRMSAESPVIGQPERDSDTLRAAVPAANDHCERADQVQPPASHGDQQR